MIASDIPMFLSDPLIQRNRLFKSGDSDDLCRVLRNADISGNEGGRKRDEYISQFIHGVEYAYKAFLS